MLTEREDVYMAKTGPSIRYHFSAPESDKQIAEWVDLQHNFSTSMRILIKDYIAKYGMRDISCLPLSISDDVEIKPVGFDPQFTVVDTTKKVEESEVAEVVEQTQSANDTSHAPDLDPMLASIMG